MSSVSTVGMEIPGFSDFKHSFFSNQALIDSDVIIISTEYSSSSSEDYQGKTLLSAGSSNSFKEASEHWRREIVSCLEAGKTVFLFLAKKNDFYIYSGSQSHSGTGRSQRTINHVSLTNNYQAFPLSGLNVINSSGERIDPPKDVTFKSFFERFEEYIAYEVYLTGSSATPIFTAGKGARTVGAVQRVGNGNLLLMPTIEYDYEQFVEANSEGKDVWSKEAIQWGHSLIQSLKEIAIGLNRDAIKTPPPAWTSEASQKLKEEIIIEESIGSLQSEIADLNSKIEAKNNRLKEISVYKDLLFEQGKPLEKAVTQALRLMGFSAEGFNDGALELDQIIVSPEGQRFIGECEGKDNKAIDISKFRQLADAIHEDFEREGIDSEAIGLLFGNAFRLEKPELRKESFTKKCMEGAKRRCFGLINTPELFAICQYLLENPDAEFAKLCRETIVSQLGGQIKFPAPPVAILNKDKG